MTNCNSCNKGEIDALGSCVNCGYSPTFYEKIRYNEFFPIYVAGVALIINSLVTILGMIGEIETDDDPFNSPKAHLTSIFIGALLLKGSKNGLNWARVSIWLGLVIFTGVLFAQKEYVAIVLQVVWSVGLLILIYPDVSSSWMKRMASGYLFLIIALNSMAALNISETNFLQGIALHTETDEIQGNTVAILDSTFTVSIPNDSWKRRNDEFAKAANEDVTLWILRPFQDLHVQVIIESVPIDYTYNLDVMFENVFDNLTQTLEADSLIHLESDTLSEVKSMVGEISGVAEGMDVTFINGVFTYNNYLVQINAFGRTNIVAESKSELMDIIKSISFNTAALDTIDPMITGNNYYDPEAELEEANLLDS